MDYNRPFYDDYPFPAGRLREGRTAPGGPTRSSLPNAPLNLCATEQQRMVRQDSPLRPAWNSDFFCGLAVRASRVVCYAGRPVTDLRNVVLVSGLANADPLEHYVRQTFQLKSSLPLCRPSCLYARRTRSASGGLTARNSRADNGKRLGKTRRPAHARTNARPSLVLPADCRTVSAWT